MANLPSLRLSRWSGTGRDDFTIELDAPGISALPAHDGAVLKLPLTAKPDEVGYGESLVALHGRLVLGESAMNNPGIRIPMQTWHPHTTWVEVPLTFVDIARAEIARNGEDLSCFLELTGLANLRHKPMPQPQGEPPALTQAWVTTVVRDPSGTGVTFTLLRQHWLTVLKSAGFERVRLVELPVASGAVGSRWVECMRLLARANGELRSNQSENAVATCREVVEGITTVMEQQWGVSVPRKKTVPERVKELAGRMGAAWPDDETAGDMLAALYSATWSWTSGEHHYGSRVPRHDEAEFAIGLTAALLTHAGHLLRTHPEPLKPTAAAATTDGSNGPGTS